LAASLGYAQGGSIPSEKDDVHQCGDPQPVVSITTTPTTGSTFNITASTTQGKFPISQVAFYMDGNILATQSGSGPTFSTTVTPTAGVHKFSAVVTDSGYYTGTSNSITATATGVGGANLSCTGSSCQFTYTLGAFSVQLYVGSSTLGPSKSTSPATWGGTGWNNITGSGSNIKASFQPASGPVQIIYP
jgi:hypothetical protein